MLLSTVDAVIGFPPPAGWKVHVSVPYPRRKLALLLMFKTRPYITRLGSGMPWPGERIVPPASTTRPRDSPDQTRWKLPHILESQRMKPGKGSHNGTKVVI